MATRTLPAPTSFNFKTLAPLAIIMALALLALLWPAEQTKFPAEWNFGLRSQVDSFENWVKQNRDTHPVFIFFFKPLSTFIDWGLRGTENFLLGLPWVVVIVFFLLAGFLLGGLRLALIGGGSLFIMGLFGLWEQSLQTLALMLVSSGLSIAVGIPVGIFAAFNDRFDRFLRPILDTMQTMPTFVYLVPIVLFFGIARVPAVVATLIYAAPPVIRLTALGIRQVSPPAIEAARAFGATPRQMLLGVQLPLALPVIMAGVNQTIMMALSMVVIAAIIGAGGLGRETLQPLQRLEVGRALEAGLAIVLMAIMLDRLSEALSQIDFNGQAGPRKLHLPKWVPANWEAPLNNAWDSAARWLTIPARWLASVLNRPRIERYSAILTSGLILLTLFLLDLVFRFGSFPEGWRWFLRGPVDAAVDWMQKNLFEIPVGGLLIGTGPLSDFTTIFLLNPMRTLFTERLPWVVIVLGAAALGWLAGGETRQKIGLALFGGLGMFAIGWFGMWNFAMDTLSQILVTILATIAIAVPLGIWASQSDRVRDFLRPVLDFLQTIPSFVLLVPVIMLFNLGRVPGLIAAVLYAIAPGVKLTDLGIRQVEASAVEAARAFGSTRTQTLSKVQVPMALPSILVGVNQMIMLVLAMVIISGMVGGAGLGLESVNGLARGETGRGIEAGLSIVIIAMIMDRVTQAWAAKQ
jgi:glycine betaine/proline transport system permease protein